MDDIKKRLDIDFSKANTLEKLNELKVLYMGKKGIITELSNDIKDIPNSEKREYGKILNELKNYFNMQYSKLKTFFDEEKIKERLKNEKVDVTLPGIIINVGAPHIIDMVVEELEELFISMGYDVCEGPELEKDLYNFEMLNLPKGNPARDAQDTFYIKGDELLLRSQTSPVQVRTMLKNKDKTPIRIICPGKTYRRDYDDATHSHQFMQMEGLLVDKDISLSDLKGTLDVMAKRLFGNNVKTRFRSSYYPFTEPSVEFDVSCFKCDMKGCNVCKDTGWITIGGAGMVHPNVLRNCGYDPNKCTGFAFGFGIERIAMIKYGIDDIRVFYTNDLRSCKSFDKRGE